MLGDAPHDNIPSGVPLNIKLKLPKFTEVLAGIFAITISKPAWLPKPFGKKLKIKLDPAIDEERNTPTFELSVDFNVEPSIRDNELIANAFPDI
jgi:hypothetical protein